MPAAQLVPQEAAARVVPSTVAATEGEETANAEDFELGRSPALPNAEEVKHDTDSVISAAL